MLGRVVLMYVWPVWRFELRVRIQLGHISPSPSAALASRGLAVEGLGQSHASRQAGPLECEKMLAPVLPRQAGSLLQPFV